MVQSVCALGLFRRPSGWLGSGKESPINIVNEQIYYCKVCFQDQSAPNEPYSSLGLGHRGFHFVLIHTILRNSFVNGSQERAWTGPWMGFNFSKSSLMAAWHRRGSKMYTTCKSWSGETCWAVQTRSNPASLQLRISTQMCQMTFWWLFPNGYSNVPMFLR